MPTKKTVTAPVSKKPIAKKEVEAVSHDHSVLESDIDSLKKEVASLKLALAAYATLEANIKLLKVKVDEINFKETSLEDDRLTELLQSIKASSSQPGPLSRTIRIAALKLLKNK